jgi:hypothetical protein
MHRIWQDKRLHFALLLLAAMLLRVWFASTTSLWLDEAYSVVESSKPLDHILALNDNTPPLYHLMLHGWMRAFGTSEIAVRSLSIVFGILLVTVVWRFHSRQAALLVAFWPVLVELSAEARAYSLFALAATTHYLLAREKNGNPLLGALAALVIMYAHAYGVLFVLASNAVTWKKSWRWYVGQAAALVLWLAWAVWKFFTLRPDTIEWITTTTFASVQGTWYWFTAGSTGSYWGAAFQLAALFACVLYARDKRALGWASLPVLLGLLAGAFLPLYHPKYVIPAAIGIVLALKPMEKKLLVTLAAFALIATLGLAFAPRHVPWDTLKDVPPPVYFTPASAGYLHVYYSAPECLGVRDHYACLESAGFAMLDGRRNLCRADETVHVVGLDTIPDLLVPTETVVWHSTHHDVSLQELDCSDVKVPLTQS